MNWFLFYLTRSLKNSILKVVRKPSALIGYLLLIGIFGMNMFNTSRNLPKSNSIYPKMVYLVIVLLVGYTSIGIPLYSGTKKFRLKYIPADGIYLMAAPLKPLTILWYAQIKQSLLVIIMSGFMVIQIPTLINSVGMTIQGIYIFLLGYVVISFVPNVIALCAFALGLKRDLYKLVTRYATLLMCVGGVVVVIVNYLGSTSLIEGIEKGLMSDLWVFIPVIGWCYELFISSIYGYFTATALISLGLLIVTIIASFFIINRNIDEQFYEEALNTANLFDEMKQGIKQGKTQMEVKRMGKTLKAKKIKATFKRDGVLALFDKQILLTRKKGIGFIDFQTVALVILIVGPMYYAQQLTEIKPFGLMITLGIVSYALFFFQLIKSQGEDLERHYLYMLPYNGMLKLLGISMWSFLKLFIDAAIGFAIVAVVTSNSFSECLLGAVFIALLGYLFYLVSILAIIFFSKTGTLVLRTIVGMLFYVIFSISIVIVIAVSIQIDPLQRQWIGLLIANIFMVGMIFILLIPASLIVKKPEFNQ